MALLVQFACHENGPSHNAVQHSSPEFQVTVVCYLCSCHIFHVSACTIPYIYLRLSLITHRAGNLLYLCTCVQKDCLCSNEEKTVETD